MTTSAQTNRRIAPCFCIADTSPVLAPHPNLLCQAGTVDGGASVRARPPPLPPPPPPPLHWLRQWQQLLSREPQQSQQHKQEMLVVNARLGQLEASRYGALLCSRPYLHTMRAHSRRRSTRWWLFWRG